jgi:preprotein translocase subunit SecD
MRRALPFVIVVLGLLAILVDFFPGPVQTLINQVSPADQTRTIETRLGLDLVGGLQVEYRLVPVGDRMPDAGALATTKTIVENRVNSQGVTEPVVQTQGTDRVVVELPGISDPGDIRKLLAQTGILEFVPLPAETYGTSTSPGPQFATEGQPLPTPEQPLFNGTELADAFATTDEAGGRAVGFKLKDTGAKLFADYTSSHVGEYFAILLDGNVVSAPYIKSAITGGQGIITGGGAGGFTAKEMNNLVTVLDYGSLPFPLEEMSFQQIGATLAGFSFDAMLFAGLIAIILVLAFMIVYYRLPGVVASFALVFYALIVYAIFRLIGVTLTLAGIAAFVLSIGMAVDANILIFERMREELRAGKTLPAAIEAGFNRAWNSILDSNVSSLITASILYVFGTSVIKGFALILIIGVLTSMFTAITVTRTILRVVVDVEGVRRASWWGVTEEEWTARAVRPGTRREARTRV